jgi:hypothetical protein
MNAIANHRNSLFLWLAVFHWLWLVFAALIENKAKGREANRMTLSGE